MFKRGLLAVLTLLFAMLSLSTGAIEKFSVSALVQGFDVTLPAANMALTVFMFASAFFTPSRFWVRIVSSRGRTKASQSPRNASRADAVGAGPRVARVRARSMSRTTSNRPTASWQANNLFSRCSKVAEKARRKIACSVDCTAGELWSAPCRNAVTKCVSDSAASARCLNEDLNNSSKG